MSMTKEQEAKIVELYRSEVSITRIAKDVGRSPTTIRSWVRENRLKYDLKRRRNLADKCGVNSYSVEADCKWDLTRSRKFLTMKWGMA